MQRSQGNQFNQFSAPQYGALQSLNSYGAPQNQFGAASSQFSSRPQSFTQGGRTFTPVNLSNQWTNAPTVAPTSTTSQTAYKVPTSTKSTDAATSTFSFGLWMDRWKSLSSAWGINASKHLKYKLRANFISSLINYKLYIKNANINYIFIIYH